MPRIIRSYILSPLALLFLTLPGGATDAERIAEAQLAISQNNGAYAITVLKRVSAAAQADPGWIYPAAKAYSCSGNAEEALLLFEKYDVLVPNEPEVKAEITKALFEAKSKWMSSFCPAITQVVNDWKPNFANIAGVDRGAFDGNGSPLWGSNVPIPKPRLRSSRKPFQDKLHLNQDEAKRMFYTHFYYGEINTARELRDHLYDEIDRCFSSTAAISRNKGHIRARFTDRSLPAVYVFYTTNARGSRKATEALLELSVEKYGEHETRGDIAR